MNGNHRIRIDHHRISDQRPAVRASEAPLGNKAAPTFVSCSALRARIESARNWARCGLGLVVRVKLKVNRLLGQWAPTKMRLCISVHSFEKMHIRQTRY
jgi:hypothetical protein